jgi:hypothetical protein
MRQAARGAVKYATPRRRGATGLRMDELHLRAGEFDHVAIVQRH